jgi:NAD(P)-dependent dehydrogenase (short-subunit alcohol dehydrogenase family)
MSHIKPGFGIDGVLLVTGGGSGIGREIALQFAAEGARGVNVCDINSSALEAVVKDLQARATNPDFKAIYSVTNVTKSEDCESAVADTISEWGRLDVRTM